MDKDKQLAQIQKTAEQVELLGTGLGDLVENDDTPLSALTAMQLRYVEAYAALAGQHGAMTDAARYAGYKNPPVAGSQLLRNVKVLAALRYLTEHKAHASSILAMNTLTHLSMHGNDSIRLKAAERILGYSGILIKTIHQHEHMIKDNRTPEQVRTAIAEKAAQMGLGDMIVINPAKKESNNPAGKPKTKRQLIPRRPLSDEEFEDIDFLTMEVNK